MGPERHYIYTKYDVFDKILSDAIDTTTFTNDLFRRMVAGAILAEAEEKPVDLLNDDEKLGIYIGAGIPMKYESERYTTLYDVGIALLDKKYTVFYRIPQFNRTYC